jgi:hypothetical protein
LNPIKDTYKNHSFHTWPLQETNQTIQPFFN